jgi:hypothetical protein
MKGIWWSSNSVSIDCRALLTHFFFTVYLAIITVLYTRTVALLLAGSLVLALYILYQLSTLLILFALCVMTSILTIRLVLSEDQSQASLQEPQQPREANSQETLHQAPGSLNFPETPVPATPLIRVLETIDLSSSNVKHFIDPPCEEQPSPQAIPQEQEHHMGMTMND